MLQLVSSTSTEVVAGPAPAPSATSRKREKVTALKRTSRSSTLAEVALASPARAAAQVWLPLTCFGTLPTQVIEAAPPA